MYGKLHRRHNLVQDQQETETMDTDGKHQCGAAILDLPKDVLDLIVERIAIRDMATLARVSKNIRTYIEPHLYMTVYSKTRTSHDVGGLVNLLQRRRRLIPFIKHLILDEFHPRETRRLLSIEMPNLQELLIQHMHGGIPQLVKAREINRLNRKVCPQPALWNCKP